MDGKIKKILKDYLMLGVRLYVNGQYRFTLLGNKQYKSGSEKDVMDALFDEFGDESALKIEEIYGVHMRYDALVKIGIL